MIDRNFTTKSLSARKFAPAIVVFIVVLILICLPERDIPDSPGWLDITFIDKFVHMGMFAFMTFLFLLPIAQSSMFRKIKRHYFIRICLSICIWGLITEFIQKFYVPTRSFELVDWAADTAGVVIAWIYCHKFHNR